MLLSGFIGINCLKCTFPLNSTEVSSMAATLKGCALPETLLWPRLLSIMLKVPEIRDGSQMESSVSVPFFLWVWSTYSGWNILTDICVPFRQTALLSFLCKNSGKGIRNGKNHSYWFARFDRKMQFHFPLVYTHWSLTGWFGYFQLSIQNSPRNKLRLFLGKNF